MKKIIKMMFLLLISTFLCVAPMLAVHADFDSQDFALVDCRVVSSLVTDMMNVPEDVDALRYYSGSYLDAFAKEESIFTIVSDKYTNDEVYITFSDQTAGSLSTYIMKNGYPEKQSGKKDDGSGAFFIEHTYPTMKDKYSDQIGEKIDTAICLKGAGDDTGVYIYLFTHNEHYVLFKEKAISGDEYLIPLTKFCAFAKTYQSELQKRSNDENGAVFNFSEIPGVEEYKLEGGPVILVILAIIILIVAIVAAVIIILNRFRRGMNDVKGFVNSINK